MGKEYRSPVREIEPVVVEEATAEVAAPSNAALAENVPTVAEPSVQAATVEGASVGAPGVTTAVSLPPGTAPTLTTTTTPAASTEAPSVTPRALSSEAFNTANTDAGTTAEALRVAREEGGQASIEAVQAASTSLAESLKGMSPEQRANYMKGSGVALAREVVEGLKGRTDLSEEEAVAYQASVDSLAASGESIGREGVGALTDLVAEGPRKSDGLVTDPRFQEAMAKSIKGGKGATLAMDVAKLSTNRVIPQGDPRFLMATRQAMTEVRSNFSTARDAALAGEEGATEAYEAAAEVFASTLDGEGHFSQRGQGAFVGMEPYQLGETKAGRAALAASLERSGEGLKGWANDLAFQSRLDPELRGKVQSMVIETVAEQAENGVNAAQYQRQLKGAVSVVNASAEPEVGVLDGVQSALDILGLIPGLGEPADLINAAVSAGRGNYDEAVLSLGAMVPIAGMAAVAGKAVVKAGEAATKAAGATPADVKKLVDELRRTHSIEGKRSSKRVKQLSEDMRTNGFDPDHPIDIVQNNGENYILDGHHRREAAKRAGIDEVPVNVVDDIAAHPSSFKTLEEVIEDADNVMPNRLRR